MITGAVVTATHALLGGFFIISKDIPSSLYWLFETCYSKHAVDGAAAVILGYDRGKLDCRDADYCHFRSPRKFMDMLGLKENLPKAYFGLISSLVVYHILAFYIMRSRLRN